MNILSNKNILLGITGSIAAYKSADLVSNLKKQGCNIKTVMTKSSELFITETTLEALSGEEVICEESQSHTKENFKHLSLAKWADIILIAPCTANFMNKLANGHGDDLLSTICLAFTKSIFVVPAMNPDMWNNKVTQNSKEKLKSADITMIGPSYGSHACGDIGYGRMSSSNEIIEVISRQDNNSSIAGSKILITAGPTREPIDPVRYISNYSSGKMGYAMALAAKSMGAYVEIVSGPVKIQPIKNIKTTYVDTSSDMLNVVISKARDFDIFISAAAIADYRPINYSQVKHKQSDGNLNIEFTRGADILKTVSEKYKNLFTIGFAAETDKLDANAKHKLEDKNLDMIIGNIANHELKIGFESDFNKVTVFTKDRTKEIDEDKKINIAVELFKIISSEYSKKVSLVSLDVK